MLRFVSLYRRKDWKREKEMDGFMKKVLYVTANPKSVQYSSSLTAGKEFLDTYRELYPSHLITELDLFSIDLPNIDNVVFSAWEKLQSGVTFTELNMQEQAKVLRMNELVDQFIESDYYIFVTPMWNFGFPSKLKDYIDTISIAGKTFKFTDTGPVGLLENKKCLHIHARGGVYSEGPAVESDFADRYLRTITRFLGITDYHSVVIEGAALMPLRAEEILLKGKQDAKQAAVNMG